MRPLPPHLLSDNATITSQGQLHIAGLAVSDLAREYGTPLFIYDEQHLRERCREAINAFGDGVSYATKAFLCIEMAKLVHEEGMCLDVSTLGEFHVARTAGVPPERMVLHGNNKSTLELETAMEAGIGRIVIDSFDEITRIEEIHERTQLCAKALVRITPGVKAHTHEYIATGQNDSKFGFTFSTGLADQAIEQITNSPAIELAGIHAHIGSQVFSIKSLKKSASVLAEIAKKYAVKEVSVGGGLGVAYVEGEEAPSISNWAKVVNEVFENAGSTAHVTAEPGRSIVASAAITVYEVGTIKNLEGIRRYVAVDGGMSDNPRPVLYGSGYEVFKVDQADAERDMQVRVVGKHCESGDVLVRDGALPSNTEIGDYVATPVTGAYGYALASNYNRVLKPAVIFVKDGQARLVLRRETLQELTALDVAESY